MNSTTSDKQPAGRDDGPDDEEEEELREYSSPACAMHEFDLAGERAAKDRAPAPASSPGNPADHGQSKRP